jgi:hypothetical protein
MPEGYLRVSVQDGHNMDVLQQTIAQMLSADLTEMLRQIEGAQQAAAAAAAEEEVEDEE